MIRFIRPIHPIRPIRLIRILRAASTAAALCGPLCGCGHNIGTCIHGKAFNIGYDPELNKFGIQYYDGVIVTGLQKELSSTSLNFTDTTEKNGVKTTSTLTYGTKQGDQITGYAVDAIKAAK